jgi:hypothetical protein
MTDAEHQTIEGVLREVNRDVVPQFEERLRSALAERDRAWLVDQIVRLALDAHSLQALDRRIAQEDRARARAQRAERVTAMAIDAPFVEAFVARHGGLDRAALVAGGALSADAPAKGNDPMVARIGRRPGKTFWSRRRTSCSGCSSGTKRPGHAWTVPNVSS